MKKMRNDIDLSNVGFKKHRKGGTALFVLLRMTDGLFRKKFFCLSVEGNLLRGARALVILTIILAPWVMCGMRSFEDK